MKLHWLLVERAQIPIRLKHLTFHQTLGLKLQLILIMISKFQFIYSFLYSTFYKFPILSIGSYATITTSQGALFIGGYSDGNVATVACYNNAGWSKLDDLQSIRRGHRAIINGDKVYVVGGYWTRYISFSKPIIQHKDFIHLDFRFYTEIWSDDKGSKSIKLADPKLDSYNYYPELVLVDTNFCVKPWIKIKVSVGFSFVKNKNFQRKQFNKFF